MALIPNQTALSRSPRLSCRRRVACWLTCASSLKVRRIAVKQERLWKKSGLYLPCERRRSVSTMEWSHDVYSFMFR